ncbi:hypothetical protein V8C37DRAFT_365683 [Trichoderma ceciliae]
MARYSVHQDFTALNKGTYVVSPGVALNSPSVAIGSLLAQPAGLGGDGAPFRKCLLTRLARHWTQYRVQVCYVWDFSWSLCVCVVVYLPARLLFVCPPISPCEMPSRYYAKVGRYHSTDSYCTSTRYLGTK